MSKRKEIALEEHIESHARVTPGLGANLPKEGSPEWNAFQKELDEIAAEFGWQRNQEL